MSSKVNVIFGGNSSGIVTGCYVEHASTILSPDSDDFSTVLQVRDQQFKPGDTIGSGTIDVDSAPDSDWWKIALRFDGLDSTYFGAVPTLSTILPLNVPTDGSEVTITIHGDPGAVSGVGTVEMKSGDGNPTYETANQKVIEITGDIQSIINWLGDHTGG